MLLLFEDTQLEDSGLSQLERERDIGEQAVSPTETPGGPSTGNNEPAR